MQLIPTRNLLLNQGSVEEKRAEIRDYFLKTYSLYEKLFELLKDEQSYYLTADPLRHPWSFILGIRRVFLSINSSLLS